ncbi:DHA2 family efflux MFS transporter permease subunit [Afifella sp. IM 167]|uniref:DHA2 family efflux MFS transporter permease subunit n=1 Tax=Afifella sp. IM 167 TaxID=2033586 RepID=UPI001CCBE5C1|nr:DHA2 family efflux MFS transporter permease subunit [Afifella sp. IM 167]MBZ8133964.1 EmrB/QacA family drug resistance transporter [Afifella sp. IM 167]
MSDAAASPAAGEAPQAINRPMVTVFIMLATIMQILDTTIANVALPSMRGSLGATQDQVTWVLTSYIVAAAIMTPVTGWLAERFGTRELFIGSVVGFTATSMLCGMSTGLEMMVIFRILQGICGAALVPLSQSVLLDINPREKHGQAMAIWGAGIMIGPIIGPTLGGWLTDTFNWRWVFFVNLPIGIIALIGMVLFLPKAKQRTRGFDFLGFALLALAIGSLQMLLDRGEQVEWFASKEVWIELGLTVSGLWAFIIHAKSVEHPFLDLRIFKDRNLVIGLIMIFMIGMILLAALALLPPMLQNIMGYPVVTTGFVMAPRGVGTMISMILVGRLVQRFDPRLLIFVGLSLAALSLYQMTCFTPQMDNSLIIMSGVVQGLGLGFVMVPLSTVAFATLAPRYRTDGTSLFSLLRNIGSSVGISIVTTVLAHNLQINHAELVERITPFNPMVSDAAKSLGVSQETALAVLSQEVQRQAAMIGYIDDFKLMMIITLAVIPLLLFMRKPARAGGPNVAME